MTARSLSRSVSGPFARAINRRISNTATEVIRNLLFSSGQQGVMYVPQPVVGGKQVLYQDAAGTTPVTADGDPVGLMLDLSRGLVLGEELLDDPLVMSDGVDLGGGVYEWVGDSVSVFLSEGSGIEFGQRYSISFEVFDYSGSGSVGVSSVTTSDTSSYRVTGDGVVSGIMLIDGSDPDGVFSLFGRDGVSFKVRNISVRELPGNHAPQSSASLKPLYALNPQQLDFDELDDELPVTFPVDMGADVTIGRAVPTVGGEILTGQTVGTSYDITQDMAALIIVNESLSAASLDKLQTYLDTMAGV